MGWTHGAASVLAAFLGSLVEFVEALTIVLAVGIVRGWRSALAGVAAGCLLLVLVVVLAGPLLAHIRIEILRLAVGTLLLLFGMRWLRKAILRGAGVIPLHDESASFASETARLRAAGPTGSVLLDPIAVLTTFKAVVLEGLEVVFIVVAVGATGNALIQASSGAAIAGLLVVALGVALHRPLTRIPENSLKFAVGILLSAFGIFWVGEGFGFSWPGKDLFILAIIAALLTTAFLAARLARRRIAVVRAA